MLKELQFPRSTNLSGILASRDPSEVERCIIAPDSPRWTEDFYLTNNFWTYLLPSGTGRIDMRHVFEPDVTMGQYFLQSRGTETLPYGYSIQYLRCTPEEYFAEIELATQELHLKDEVDRYSEIFGIFLQEGESALGSGEKDALFKEDPIRSNVDFEYRVARPVFRRLLEKGFSLIDLQT